MEIDTICKVCGDEFTDLEKSYLCWECWCEKERP